MSQDRVRQIENASYTKSRVFLLNHPRGERFLSLVDKTNDALIATWNPDYNNSTEDELTLKYNGYYQISFSLQRDLIEVQFLLDLFRTYPQKIKDWKDADDKILRKEFSPAEIRDILDKSKL